VLVIGCGDDSPGSSGTDATEGTTADTSSSTGNTSPSSSSASATDSASESGSSEGSSSTGGSESTSLSTSDTESSSSEGSSSTTVVEVTTSSSTDPSTSSESGLELLPNGDTCSESDECESGSCYLAGILGGICGECLDDDDCVWGCGAPNPLGMPPTGSTCDDGGVGAGCETDAACQMTLTCAEIISVPGIIDINGCSECEIDADCDELCSPNYEASFTEFEGHWECITAGSLPLGAGCNLAGSGDAACDSTFCASADIMGLLQIGVCSECEIDMDCGAGGTCEAPQVDLDGTFTPGACL
jgi:hypothetical protein